MCADLKAVIFDVDGTLVESERDGHRIAFNAAFERRGLPYRWDPDVYRELLRTTGGRRRIAGYLVSVGHPEAEAASLAEELHRAKTAIFKEMAAAGSIPLRSGVRELVDDLREQGIPQYVATTGTRDWVEPLLRLHFGEDAFELVVTGTEVPRLKPDPEVYRHVLRTAGLPARGVVAVEDSVNGVQAAHGAGLACLAVRNDYTSDPVTDALLVVSGFGPGARRLCGAEAPLPGGRVTTLTLRSLLEARPHPRG